MSAQEEYEIRQACLEDQNEVFLWWRLCGEDDCQWWTTAGKREAIAPNHNLYLLSIAVLTTATYQLQPPRSQALTPRGKGKERERKNGISWWLWRQQQVHCTNVPKTLTYKSRCYFEISACMRKNQISHCFLLVLRVCLILAPQSQKQWSPHVLTNHIIFGCICIFGCNFSSSTQSHCFWFSQTAIIMK